uniref:Dispatched RND transporter family member 1 n=1 Tax=Molossus molossus TaxID=27622 RepID=A0A7J8BLT6_MOLMO|nr:dispatched RND transporter family member 1 [Molossus molossus]
MGFEVRPEFHSSFCSGMYCG